MGVKELDLCNVEFCLKNFAMKNLKIFVIK